MSETIYKEVKLLNHGFVRLVDKMGDDLSVVRAARVSYGQGSKSPAEDRGVVRYMLNHDHGTPFEHTCLTYHAKMPTFVARQWIRHRIGVSYNEISGRYSEMKDEFFMLSADSMRKQSKTNKQGSDTEVISLAQAGELLAEIEATYQKEYETYKLQIGAGVSKELARAVLPLALYTEWYFTCNLRSLFAFCKLRSDSHAQEEIRIYSDAMLEMAEEFYPWSVEAFRDYQLNAIKLSTLDQRLLRRYLAAMSTGGVGCWADAVEHGAVIGMSKREIDDFKKKIEILVA